MTSPKNTENRNVELSLDQLKDIAGGYLQVVAKVKTSGTPWLKQNSSGSAGAR